MSDNSKRIKKVFKYVSQFSKFNNKLQKALEKLEWPIEFFFITLRRYFYRKLTTK